MNYTIFHLNSFLTLQQQSPFLIQSSLQSEFLVQLLSYTENSSLSPKQKYFLQS